MLRQFSLLLGSTALAALLSLGATAKARAWGGTRGLAILPPTESPDTDYSAANPSPRWGATFNPYYSPLTPISQRWLSTTCHGNVVSIPYYRGYCLPHGQRSVPYGTDGAACLAGAGCGDGSVGNYGPYTGRPNAEAVLLHLGGNAPYHPSQPGTTDLIDVLHGGCGDHGVAAP